MPNEKDAAKLLVEKDYSISFLEFIRDEEYGPDRDILNEWSLTQLSKSVAEQGQRCERKPNEVATGKYAIMRHDMAGYQEDWSLHTYWMTDDWDEAWDLYAQIRERFIQCTTPSS